MQYSEPTKACSQIVQTGLFLGLKREYEKVAGKISLRTWQRIRCKIKPESIEDERERISVIQAYALLRRWNKNACIDMSAIAQSIYLSEFLKEIDGFVEGRDLLSAFKKWKVSECTLRRWGKQIGIPFYLLSWYRPEDVQKYCQRLALSVKFSPIIRIPKSRRIV